MRNLNNVGLYKALLLAGCAGTIAIAAPASAQVSNQTGQGTDCEANPQDPRCTGGINETPAPSASTGTIVVTGSRIARQDYEANSPIVTVDETFLEQSSTAAVEQQLNKLPQFVVSQSSTAANNSESGLLPAGGDIQPNATNTPGAATVSLRGVGANRTLVLIDGRRGTPGNASGSVDVSTIPSAALERVEVISGGASATYGADAVAGVTNFILKRNFQGIELDAQMGISQYGDAFEYQLGGIMGTDFEDGRGNVSLAMSVNTRERVNQADRPWYQALWADPDATSGGFFFTPRPAITGLGLTNQGSTNPTTGVFTPGCEAQAAPRGCVLTNYFASQGANTPLVPNNTGSVFFNQDGSLFTTGFTARGGSANFEQWPGTLGVAKRTSVGTLSFINDLTPLTIPTTRYNFLARGNYEINDWVGVFAQGMFSNSTTYTVQEPGPITTGWGVRVPWGTGVYTGEYTVGGNTYVNEYVPSSVVRQGQSYDHDRNPATPNIVFNDADAGNLANNPTNPAFRALYGNQFACALSDFGGCTNTQVFQDVVPDAAEPLLNARANPNAPFTPGGFLPNPRETFSDVTTYTLIAGLEGSIPGMDWTWEAFVNHGQSRTLSRQTGMYSLERLRAIFTAPNFGRGFTFRGNPEDAGFGASTGSCTTGLNFFQNYQGISQNCREAISADVSNRITTRQTIGEANLQGGLFELPAGELRFALGASYRETRFEFINETLSTAGRSFSDQVVGIYPSANMENQGINVKEFYGELLIPVLSDLPFIEEFNLEVGGRMSDYDTTGISYTYKILGDWQVTDWLRLRGGYNRSERAPNIAELLLQPQQAFRTDPIGDVCSTRHNNPGSANPTTNPTGALDVQAVCLELMARDNGGVFVPASPTAPGYIEESFYNPTFATQRQPTGAGSAFSYAVGNRVYRETVDTDVPALAPEKADTWTIGAVIRSPLSSGPLSRLNLTVDYFNITINDPIGAIPAGGVLLRCVSPQYNPAAAGAAAGGLGSAQSRAAAQRAIAESTCPTVSRNPTGAGTGTGALNSANIIGTYGNEGQIKLAGLDATLSWSQDIGPGTLFASLNGNYMFDFKLRSLNGQPLIDYVGTTGLNALGVNSGASFEYRLFGNLGYSIGPANISLQWQHIPRTEDAGDAFFLNGLAPAGSDATGIPAYNLFNLNASYEVTDDLRLRFGVDNLFNTWPPLSNIDANINPANGEVRGGSYSLFHDVQGRRFSLGANIRF